MNHAKKLGTEAIGPLLRKQAIPAAIGILTLSINGIIDNIFVGKHIGAAGIGAITVVLPITFLIASIGMAIGVGGASVISRALGAGHKNKAHLVFGNQLMLTLLLSMFFVILGFIFENNILQLFGGSGQILTYAKIYFKILLPAIPLLAFAMMSNNVIRAEGKPKVAMAVMITPAILNIILDALFIYGLEWGMAGAAWATMISYIASGSYALLYMLLGKSSIKIDYKYLRFNLKICKEIASIGSVTLARQGIVSLLAIILNNMLISYGGEESLAIWGIINRMMMFANFPVFGITQGFLPIAGYNHGAKKWGRVQEVIQKSIIYGSLLAIIVFLFIMLFTSTIISIFINDPIIIEKTRPAMRLVFLATPTLTIQLIGAAYYQAIGKAIPAMLLTLSKQGFFLIPLLLILPLKLGLLGIWIAFPISDTLAAIVNLYFLQKSKKELSRYMSFVNTNKCK